MKDDQAPKQDVALLVAPTHDGGGVHIVRAREGRLEAGVVRPLKEGQSLTGSEVVKLTPRDDAPRLCDVTVEYSPEVAPPSTHGPPRVSSERYRGGWDRIFGDREASGPPPGSRAN